MVSRLGQKPQETAPNNHMSPRNPPDLSCHSLEKPYYEDTKKEIAVSIELLIYMIIAAVMVFWLRNTLGTRNGSEQDRSEIIDQLRERQRQQMENSAPSDRILDIPQSASDKNSPQNPLDTLKIEGGAETAQEILSLTRDIPSFDPAAFVAAAKEAFPMIVEAFAQGDLKTLKMLLSDGVYTSFEQAIDDRTSRGERLSTDVLAVRDCLIMGVKRIEQMAFIKVRFLAEETICTRDKEGQIISGNPNKSVTMNDVWTFGKSVKSKDPIWYLYETSDDVADDVPTPLPDTRHT